MKHDAWLRAYLAGMALPGVMQLVILAVYAWSASIGRASWSTAALLVFPMSLVPNAWGAWNLLYVGVARRHSFPIGVHGALLPALLLPAAYAYLRLSGHGLMAGMPASTLVSGYVLAVVAYYLIWKHVVSFLNRVMDLN